MGIQPVPRKIEEIFSVKQPYHIDFYQRDYKWGKEHIEKLIEDLFYRFDLEYEEKKDLNPTIENIDRYDWYYLSTYVTNIYEGKVFIVDGQQRLTSLTLILIELFHLAKNFTLDERAEFIKTMIQGLGLEGKKFWMGWSNRKEVLQDLLENRRQTRELTVDDISIVNLYRNYELVNKSLEQRLNTSHKLESFLLYLLRKVLLVEIQIEKSKDVPMVFEVINDRGEKLKPYEVLKGKLLGQLSKEEVNEYNTIWDERIHSLQRKNEAEADNFFRFYFRSKFVDTHLEYRAFDGDYHKTIYWDEWNTKIGLKQNIEKVKSFIKNELEYYANLYLDLLQESEKESSDLSKHLHYNYLNDQDRQYLLILSACNLQDTQGKEKIRVIAKLFDRYFTILRLTGSYDSNEFTKSIIAINENLRGKEIEDIKRIFYNQLIIDISNVKGVEIKNPFDWGYFKDTTYNNLGIRFTRYFYARIEHFLAKNCNLPCDNYYNLVRNTGQVQGYHVEHIIADNEENRNLFEDEETFSHERNRLGALTLLKGRQNLSSGNEPYLEKLKTYAGKGNLIWTQALTENFYHSNLDFKDLVKNFSLNFKSYPLKYDKKATNERQGLLFDITKIIWDEKYNYRNDV